jgi:beta-lactamase class A
MSGSMGFELLKQDVFASIHEILGSFVGEDQGRSIALSSLRDQVSLGDINGDVVRPGASLLKLPIALSAVEESAAATIDLKARIPTAALSVSRYPSPSAIFDPDRMLTLREVLGLMLATSDNPLADCLLNHVGMKQVNCFLKANNCQNTRLLVTFSDEMLDSRGRENVTTALDMLTLLTVAYRDPHAAPIIFAMKNGVRKTRIALKLPDDLPVANKTGSLTGVVNDVAILYGERFDLAIAVLCDNQPDEAWTSFQIGQAVLSLWQLLGERVA